MYQQLLPFPNWDQIERTTDLPQEFENNLAIGTPIPTELQIWNQGYSAQMVLNVLVKLFIQNPDTSHWLESYTNPVFKANLSGYLSLFGDRLEYFKHSGPPQFEFVNPLNNYVGAFPRPCIFTHGRFNGVPHPGYIHSLVYAKEHYPNLPVTLAIETDHYSIRQGQNPFLDVLFRASLLYYTGLIDRLIIIKAPYHEDDVYSESTGGINHYWDAMYGVDTGIVNPVLLISYGNDDYMRKESRAPSRLNIWHMDGLKIQSNEIHMSDIRNSNADLQMILIEWAKLLTRISTNF